MKNKDIFPFVRNNYFNGKQLTVRDFEDEQEFGIDKLRALRYNVSGAGVVSGLDVVAVDSSTVSIENGYAIDGYGRDILIGTPIMKKVSMLDGFDSVDDSREIYVCLDYSEALSEPATAMRDTGVKNYNRITEGYRIYLTNRKPRLLSNALMSLINTVKEIYTADNVSVTMTVPNYVRSGNIAEITVSVEKRGLEKPLKAELKILHDDFECDGNDYSTVVYQNMTDSFDRAVFKLRLSSKNDRLGISKLRLSAENIKISIDDVPCEIEDNTLFNIEIIDESVKERVKSEYFHTNIDTLFSEELLEPIYLAELRLKKEGRNAVIDSVTAMPFKQYVMSSRLLYLLNLITEEKDAESETYTDSKTDAPIVRNENINASSGTVTIDIPVDLKGKIYYSTEIVHGLGEGNISFTVGFEDISGTESVIVFGNAELFKGSRYDMDFPPLEYAIMSYNDKGTFRIAVQLLRKLNAGSVKAHWNAVKTDTGVEKDILEIDKVSISIKPNLVRVEPRETVPLTCVIEGCDNNACIWSVEDKNGGTIDRNGFYKAPTAEGVYTVTASSVKYPTKKATNYIIVNKKKEL